MSLILSPSLNPPHDTTEWLHTLQPFLQDDTLYPFQPALDLPVKRHGYPGILSDNPPVDRIDRLMDQLQQNTSQLGVISVPLSITILQENTREEISLLNGWIDLAGYTGCGRFRILVNGQETIPEDILPFLREVIAYAADLDIPVTLTNVNAASIESVGKKTYAQSSVSLGAELFLSIDNQFQLPDPISSSHINLFSIHYSEQLTDWLPQLDSLPHPVVINI